MSRTHSEYSDLETANRLVVADGLAMGNPEEEEEEQDEDEQDEDDEQEEEDEGYSE